MLNYIWAIMIASSFLLSFINGTYASVMDECISAAKNSVSTIIAMGGIMCFWTGFLNVAQGCGVIEGLKKILMPVLKIVFPDASKDDAAADAMLSNICANLLGMGNAATPFGVKAMERMDSLNAKKAYPSRDMCAFAVMNTASVTLIPTTVMAISGGGGDILVPIWICSFAALIFGLAAVRIWGGKNG